MKYKLLICIISTVSMFSVVKMAQAFNFTNNVVCAKIDLISTNGNTSTNNAISCEPNQIPLSQCITNNICNNNSACIDALMSKGMHFEDKIHSTTIDSFFTNLIVGGDNIVDSAYDYNSVSVTDSDVNRPWSKFAEEWKLPARRFVIAKGNKDQVDSCQKLFTRQIDKVANPPRLTRTCCLTYNQSGIKSCQARSAPCINSSSTSQDYVQMDPIPIPFFDSGRDGINDSQPGIYNKELDKANPTSCQNIYYNLDIEKLANSTNPDDQKKWLEISRACCTATRAVCSDSVLNVPDDKINAASQLGLHSTGIPNIRPTVIYMRPTVGIPGTNFSTGQLVAINAGTLGKFLGQFFGFALSVVAIMAILMIIIAGATMYFKAAKGDINGAAKAKDQIKGAILGLVFTLAAVTIFRFISPRLVEIPSLTTENIAVNLTDKFAFTAADVANESDGGKSSGSVQCKNDKYGATYTEARANGQNFTVKTKNASVNVFINKALIPALTRVNLALANVDYSPLTTAGGYADKIIADSTSISNHHWGIAIDFNPEKNKQYLAKNKTSWAEVTAWRQSHTGYNASCPTNIPEAFVKAFTDNGFAWGGAWKTTCDAMHFEYIADCSGSSSSSSNGGTISQCIPSAETGNTVSETTSNQTRMKDVLAKIATGVDTTLPASFNSFKESIKRVAKAQAVLESGWGSSDAAKNHNYFGIKCVNVNPANCDADKKYRSYSSDEIGISDYLSTLNKWSGQITEVVNLSGGKLDLANPCNVAYYVIQGPSRRWATDPNYGQKLADVINNNFGACDVNKSLQNVIKGVCN